MGFIGKILSAIGSAALLMVGASGASASTPPDSKEQGQSSVLGMAGELLAAFVVDTGGRYTEDTVEAAVRRMVEGMSPDRFTELPEFVRGLRTLELAPEVEVAAVETLISTLEELSGLVISSEQAAVVTGQIFDEFVEPLQVARQGRDPGGKFSDRDDFPGNDSAWDRGEKRGRPFQPS